MTKHHFPSIIKTYGSSMFPMLIDQDVVYLSNAKFQNIKVTDVICIKKRGRIMTHRVIYKKDNYLITKGDSNIMSDGRIYSKNVIGKVSKIRRNGQTITLSELYLFQATIYFDELKKITKEFKKHTIEFLILKGIPHDLYYSKTHPSRIYSDCDILISPGDREKADTILKDLSYKTESLHQLTYLQNFIGSEVKELIYFRERDNFIFRFDIHYEINIFSHITKLPFPFLQKISNRYTNEMKKNKKLIEVNGVKFPLLRYDDLLIYLLLHTFGHGYTGALRFEAIAVLFRNKNLTNKHLIDMMIEKANSYSLINFMTPALYLLKEYYNVNAPYDTLKQKFPRKVKFSMATYNMITSKESLFDDMTATYSARFRRAVFLVLYSETNLANKIYYLFQPKLILHLIFFVLVYLETKVRKKNFLESD